MVFQKVAEWPKTPSAVSHLGTREDNLVCGSTSHACVLDYESGTSFDYILHAKNRRLSTAGIFRAYA